MPSLSSLFRLLRAREQDLHLLIGPSNSRRDYPNSMFHECFNEPRFEDICERMYFICNTFSSFHLYSLTCRANKLFGISLGFSLARFSSLLLESIPLFAGKTVKGAHGGGSGTPVAPLQSMCSLCPQNCGGRKPLIIGQKKGRRHAASVT